MSFDADNVHPPSELHLASDRHEADPAAAPRSALLLVAGIVLAVIGGAVMALGWTMPIEPATQTFGADPGRGPLILGALLTLTGITLQVVGIWRLAANVDYLAQREKDREHAP